MNFMRIEMNAAKIENREIIAKYIGLMCAIVLCWIYTASIPYCHFIIYNNITLYAMLARAL